MKIPMQIFVELMPPLDTGDTEMLEWDNEAKTNLKPTKVGKRFDLYHCTITKPSVNDRFWRLQDREKPRRIRVQGQMVTSNRGKGCAKLHLSQAAEERGETTALLTQVTGNTTIQLKVPTEERAMPTLKITLKVSTLNKFGHIEWVTTFGARTAAALAARTETLRANGNQKPSGR